MLDAVPESVAELPVWNYDGSSTEQAPGEDSEVPPAACLRKSYSQILHCGMKEILSKHLRDKGNPM